MLFNSWQFVVFLPLVAAVYFLLPLKPRLVFLLAANYFFYMQWKAAYALLLAASTLADYVLALLIARAERPALRRSWLAFSVAVNLALLFSFKYFGLFSRSVKAVGAMFGADVPVPVLDVLLPVGISFYTFQSLSYTIDVYRRRVTPERNLLRYAVYVSFFPQLVAGPIERAWHLMPQLFRDHVFEYERVVDGLKLIAWGLFKKIVVADRLAMTVDAVYSDPSGCQGPQLLLATVFFAYQIYCDFSGYSDVAIGSAQVLGVRLMTNFDRPYAAQSIGEFWRRWHISLSTWFKDYVYISLGGNRVGVVRGYVNIMAVFVISGLWHGANYTFLVWGALHGFYMVFGRLTQTIRSRMATGLGLVSCPGLLTAMRRLTCFGLVCLAWVFFRAASLEHALAVLSGLPKGWTALFQMSLEQYGAYGARIGLDGAGFLLALVLIGFTEWFSYAERGSEMRHIMRTRPALLRWVVGVALVVMTLNLGVAKSIPFIYFQF
jgi:D-alanyl-lipoteichoic acid acyltransferase DltB (MBOAT superfamily)